MPAVPAERADEAVRPAQPDQRRAALPLRAEGLAKRLVALSAHARCYLDGRMRDLPIWNVKGTYKNSSGVSRISKDMFMNDPDIGSPPLFLFMTEDRLE